MRASGIGFGPRLLLIRAGMRMFPNRMTETLPGQPDTV